MYLYSTVLILYLTIASFGQLIVNPQIHGNFFEPLHMCGGGGVILSFFTNVFNASLDCHVPFLIASVICREKGYNGVAHNTRPVWPFVFAEITVS